MELYIKDRAGNTLKVRQTMLGAEITILDNIDQPSDPADAGVVRLHREELDRLAQMIALFA